MPTVTKTVKVKAKATTKAIIKQESLTKLQQLAAQVEALKEKLKPVEKEMEKLELSVLIAATGLKKDVFWKKLSPEKMQKLLDIRYAKGLVATEAGKLDYGILKTDERKTPKWKDIYTLAMGQDKANEVQANTPTSYSYHVNVAATE